MDNMDRTDGQPAAAPISPSISPASPESDLAHANTGPDTVSQLLQNITEGEAAEIFEAAFTQKPEEPTPAATPSGEDDREEVSVTENLQAADEISVPAEKKDFTVAVDAAEVITDHFESVASVALRLTAAAADEKSMSAERDTPKTDAILDTAAGEDAKDASDLEDEENKETGDKESDMGSDEAELPATLEIEASQSPEPLGSESIALATQCGDVEEPLAARNDEANEPIDVFVDSIEVPATEESVKDSIDEAEQEGADTNSEEIVLDANTTATAATVAAAENAVEAEIPTDVDDADAHGPVAYEVIAGSNVSQEDCDVTPQSGSPSTEKQDISLEDMVFDGETTLQSDIDADVAAASRLPKVFDPFNSLPTIGSGVARALNDDGEVPAKKKV
ncbi:uncharacterized protein V2V93DRAFT_368051, partial [Kockiozyma suomiensis]|uniref:uncharacterized protein n=1 Tax=Kockiozyma suomiensis TaxID=1337062 RepID=UPI00334360B3